MNAAGADALGSLAQLGNQSIGQSIGYGISAKLASTAWDKQKNLLTRGPTYARIGLEKAGYNPILYLHGGGPGAATKAPQGAMPGSYGAPNMTTGSARQLMSKQAEAAEATMKNQLQQANLAATQYQTMLGQVAEARKLSEFLEGPEGAFWVRQKYINQSLPNTGEAAILKMLTSGASAAKSWYERD